MRIPALLLSLLILLTSAHAQTIQFGVITDFDHVPIMDSVLEAITTELDRTTGSAKKVVLSKDQIIYSTRTFADAQKNYETVSAEVDFVLLIGAVSIKGALQSSTFSKPTFGLGIIDPGMQEIPFADNKSGVPNFTYIKASQNLEEVLGKFKQLYPFKNLTVLTDGASAITFDQAKALERVKSLSQQFATSITVIAVSEDISGSLQAIPSETDAIYLTEMYGKTNNEVHQIAKALIDEKLPSFSASKSHVDNGILGCISDKNELDQVIRKLAIMVDDWLGGSSLANMPVNVNHNHDFFLNISTAKSIGLSPPFEIIFTAEIVGENDIEETTYSLEEVMQKALEANLDIQVSYKDIGLSDQDIKIARSAMLPDIGLAVNGSQINASSGTVFSPERQLTGQVSFQQVLFSEEAIAAIKITKLVRKAQEYNTEADVLAILFDTYNAYFNVLAANTNLQLQQENLTNSKINLESAKTKVDFGSASNADVYRWESEVAQSKQNVINSQTQLLASKLQLNSYLGNKLEREYAVEDVTIDDALYEQYKNDLLAQFITTPRELELVADFLVAEALDSNPNKRELLASIEAAEREKARNRRLYYTPQVAIQAQGGRVFTRGGEGSVAAPGTELVDNTWQVGFSLSYPLFQGNVRRANVQKSTILLEQLDNSNQSLDINLELSVRTTALELLSTTTNIAYSKVSADNAQLNFELVQDNYKQGQVTITQLIDAQQAALQAKLNYFLSIYDYLQAQLKMEYSLGYFSMFATPEKAVDFEQRFLEFISNE